MQIARTICIERRCERGGSRSQALVSAMRGRQLPRDAEQRTRLPLAASREPLPIPLPPRQPADDDADKQQEQQRDQLVRASHDDREAWLHEEDVVDEECPDGRAEGRDGAPPDGNGGNRKQVDR